MVLQHGGSLFVQALLDAAQHGVVPEGEQGDASQQERRPVGQGGFIVRLLVHGLAEPREPLRGRALLGLDAA